MKQNAVEVGLQKYNAHIHDIGKHWSHTWIKSTLSLNIVGMINFSHSWFSFNIILISEHNSYFLYHPCKILFGSSTSVQCHQRLESIWIIKAAFPCFFNVYMMTPEPFKHLRHNIKLFLLKYADITAPDRWSIGQIFCSFWQKRCELRKKYLPNIQIFTTLWAETKIWAHFMWTFAF